MSVIAEFNTTRDLVLYVLEHYPDTRNSDNKLFVQCAKLRGATTLDDLEATGLNLISVHKCRQKVQNKEGLFLPDPDVTAVRTDRKNKIKEWMVS